MGTKKCESLQDKVQKLREKGMSVKAIARKLHIGDHKAGDMIRAMSKAKPGNPDKADGKPKTVDCYQAIANLRVKRGSSLPKSEKSIKAEVDTMDKVRVCEGILDLKKKGLTLKQIGRRIGKSDKFVSAVVREHGWQSVGKKTPAAGSKDSRGLTEARSLMSTLKPIIGNPILKRLFVTILKAFEAYIENSK
jgi:transcriptional regulator